MVTLTVSRFAPSPTGLLHLGNARTAFFSWLYARHRGGRFVLRIEDTDASRSRPEHVEALLADMAWLGLDFDAGPGKDTPEGPYWQSQRAGIYEQAFNQLQAMGRAYPCYCTALELELARKMQLSRGQAPRYAGTCRDLTLDQRAAREAEGRQGALRFQVPGGRELRYQDLVRGEQVFSSDALGDFIIQRADGSASFLASNAIDDALMGVTDVLRGEDHVANTPRQLLLLEVLEHRLPRYGHLPLLVGDDGAPLAKRHGATSVSELRGLGYRPEAVLNLLFRLGHSAAVEGWATNAGMIEGFRPEHLGRAPARLDMAQLTHWQKEAVKLAHADQLADWVPATVPADDKAAFIAAVRANLTLPADAKAMADMIYEDLPPLTPELEAIVRAAGAATFEAAVLALDSGADWSGLTRSVREATGRKGRDLFQPLRAALTHALEGPEMAPLLALMGPLRARARFEQALTACQ